MGVLITMEAPTKNMRAEAASAGFYKSEFHSGYPKQHPRIQIITVAELLDGTGIDAPEGRDIRTFKRAPKAKRKKEHRQMDLIDPNE
jgi:site-specific DNA-methyltransferase (adenine-specific)